MLYNFKMHKTTNLKLSEVPIIVISGANGSGKTQILEALIIAIGHVPNRVSLSTYKEVVGPFDKHSQIKLTLNNPVLGDNRVFSSSDPELIPFIENEFFIVDIKINQEGNIRRKIIDKHGKGINVTKRQIQILMRNIGIFDDTMLNFTEEGYLSSFADGSPHKKLDSLLVATGLKEIFNSYINSKKKVQEKEREYSPLVMQLEKEESKLERLRENFERIQKKRELIERYESLEKELFWFNALESQKHLEDASQNLTDKKNCLEEIEKKLSISLIDQDKLKSEVKEAEEILTDKKTRMREMSDHKNRLEGQKEEKTRAINSSNNQIRNINQKLGEFENIQTDEGLTQKRNLQRQLDEVNKELSQLNNELQTSQINLKNKAAEEDKIKQRINERSQLYGELSDYERKLIKDCILYKERIQNSDFKNEIIGPIYEIISIKKGFENYTEVVKASLGRYLFGFVATTHNAYREAKRIYDEIFPSFKPNFTVGRVLEDEKGPKPDYLTNQTLDNKPEGIIDFAVNLIEAPFQVKLYLVKFVRILLGSPALSPNLLTDYAKQFKTNILTTDCNSFYLSQEAFSRPPRRYNIKLSLDLNKYQSIERIREQLQLIQFDIEKITEDKIRITRGLADCETRKRDLENQLRPWKMGTDEIENEFLRLQQIKSAAETLVRTETENLTNLDLEISKLADEIVVFENDVLGNQKKFDTLKNKLFHLNEEIKDLSAEKDKNIRLIDILEIEVTDLKTTYENLHEQAIEKGESPENIRSDKEEITSEYNRIKGQLELLEITPEVSQESIERQEKHVNTLQEEVKNTEVHLNNLKQDLDKRISEWEGGLHNIVDHLNKMLNLLLQDIFENVSIQIRNYNDEKNAGLHIEAETKGDDRRYRQLSGGEKTLLAQAIILALHMINHSPIHAIDEFTQKLDKRNKALAFSMALATYRISKESRIITPQFILITPSLDDVELSKEFAHKVLIESKVKTNEVRA
jgi:chromosome segregation ATPase